MKNDGKSEEIDMFREEAYMLTWETRDERRYRYRLAYWLLQEVKRILRKEGE